MRVRDFLGVVSVLFLAFPSVVGATTQNFYLHYSAGGVSIPGGSTSYYLNQTAPTAGTPTIYGAVSVNAGQTINFPTFTATALGSNTDLERLVTITLNLSANHVMNNCVDLSAVLERVSSAGAVTALGDGTETNVSLPQGTGGGLSGYAPKSISLAMDVDRTIASGASLRIRVSLTNSCASNASVRLIFDGTPAQSTTEFTTPDATIFGAPGTFGSVSIANATLARAYVPNWDTEPGHTFFFPTVAPSDGTVFVANYFQTHNAFLPTACDMAVTCFNPLAKECPVGGGVFDYFSNIRIPDSSGNVYTPTIANPSLCASQATQGGMDVTDVELVDTDRIMLGSNLASYGSSSYPVLGFLTKSSGDWALETPPRYAADLASDPGVGSLACPSGSCGGMNEFATLPDSGRVVITDYVFGGGAQGGITITDSAGILLAFRAEPVPQSDSNGCLDTNGNPVGVFNAARGVAVDPTSTVPDERFTVSYDNFSSPTGHTRSQVIQEFSYDDVNKTITPISAPIFVASPTGTSPYISSAPCGLDSTRQGLSATYDQQGNLWTVRRGDTADVFVKSGGTRRTETDSACAYAGTSWGLTCPADYEFGGVQGSNSGGPVQDQTSGQMLYAGRNGRLSRFDPSSFTAKSTSVAFGLGGLPKIPASASFANDLFISGITVDQTRRIAWLPVQAFPRALYGNPIPPGQDQQPIWLFAVDLARLTALP